jgi:hypothetical protein
MISNKQCGVGTQKSCDQRRLEARYKDADLLFRESILVDLDII